MRIVSPDILPKFWQKHTDAETPLKVWLADTRKAQWKEPRDVEKQFSNVRIIGANRAVFNVKGNNYRLVVVIQYKKGLVDIRFVGTHAEYDRIDPREV
ncbi:MAG: type II toxin-antitoxin system HigB family toxin [Deltaproteobacteria bacterium]|nr:type II toxin-antitoxin system HigB family toxin [Deltaproteobacteria bacterium]